MARRTDERTISVPLSLSDDEAFRRLRGALENISAARLGRILLHYGIRHADVAVAEVLREALDQDAEPPR